jgi:hypothetical protein
MVQFPPFPDEIVVQQAVLRHLAGMDPSIQVVATAEGQPSTGEVDEPQDVPPHGFGLL